MKKMFTLLVAVGMVAVAQAQPGQRDNRQFDQRNNQQNDQRDLSKPTKANDVVIYNNPYDNNRYNDRNDDRFAERRRDLEISGINQEYDYKIQKVKRNFFLNWFEKQRQIRLLEDQRQREINMVYAKFKNNRSHYDEYNNRSHGRY